MDVAAALVLTLGLASGLVGYRLFRAAVVVYGAIAGAGIAVAAASTWLDGWWLVGAVVAGALLGAGLARFAERAAFFLAGASLGWMVGLGAAAASGVDALVPVAIVGAVVGGVGLLWLERALVTLATSAIGAWAVVHGAGALAAGAALDLAGPFPDLGHPALAPAACLTLTVVFAGIQALSGGRRRSAPED